MSLRESPLVAVFISINTYFAWKVDIMLENMLRWLVPIVVSTLTVENGCDHPLSPTNEAHFLPLQTLDKHNEMSNQWSCILLDHLMMIDLPNLLVFLWNKIIFVNVSKTKHIVRRRMKPYLVYWECIMLATLEFIDLFTWNQLTPMAFLQLFNIIQPLTFHFPF